MNHSYTKILAMSAAVCLSLTACGGETASESASEQADLSNTLVYAGESESTINPILNSHDEVPDLIFSGLMKYDGDGTPVCDLAEEYSYDPATLTYVFLLRDGVSWHDGAPFTAADVVFTYEALMHDETLSASITSNYEDIQSVNAVDDRTVTFTLSQPNAAMLSYFTMGILPEHLLEGEDLNTAAFNQSPVGTGRYKFVEWDTAGGMIVLERNKDYYGKVPNIERIVYKTVSVESTKATMLQSGEADLAWLNAKYADQFRDKEGYQNIDFQTADYRGISMDFRTEFWQRNGDSIGVLNEALDKNAIIAGVLDGRGTAAYSPIQLSRFGGNPAADCYPYDLDKFAQDMKALGWVKGDDGIYQRNGDRFHFTIQVREYEEERVDIANLCASMLRSAGVEMEVVLVTRFDWTEGYNGFLSGYAAQFDPDQCYANDVTGASGNTMQYSNPEVDALLTEGRHATDDAQRTAAYQAFEAAYAQRPGAVLVAYLEGNYVSIDGLKGLDTSRLLGHHAVGVLWNVEEWTLEK